MSTRVEGATVQVTVTAHATLSAGTVHQVCEPHPGDGETSCDAYRVFSGGCG